MPVGKEIQIYDRGSWNKVDSITIEADTEVSLNTATDIVGFYDRSKIITVLLHKIKWCSHLLLTNSDGKKVAVG